ncbi:unnamed protein product [Closterium sp. NIES-65]|nr:unnamed protein product [Closterium sp. NIES-65]
MAAVRALVLACVLLLVSTSALAQRGPPGGGPPGGQRGGPGAGSGGPGGPGGPDGKPPHGPPLNLTAVGNLTADIGARLANCTMDQKTLNGSFHIAVFKNATGNYNLLVEALLVDTAGGPPDSIAIVKGAVCDSAATDVLALPLAAADWQQRAGWWLLHAEARLDAFLENADAATLDALLAVLPTASPPPISGGGRNGGGSSAGGGSAGGARNGQGGRRMGRELLMHAFGLAARQGGQKQGGQQQGGQQQGGQKQQGGAQQAPVVSGYAVLAGSSAAGVTVRMPRVGEAEMNEEGERLLAERWRAAESSARKTGGRIGGGDVCSGDEAVSRMYNGDSTGRETDPLLERGAYKGTGNNEYGGQDVVTGGRSIARIREGIPPAAGAEKGVPRGVVILVVVFLDLFAVGMAMPLVTPLIKELGASPLQVGFLSSTYGAVQLVTGPFFGLLSDSMGRRDVILVSYAGAEASYLLSTTPVALFPCSLSGLLSDSMGRRVVTLVSYAGAGASYLLLGQSSTVTVSDEEKGGGGGLREGMRPSYLLLGQSSSTSRLFSMVVISRVLLGITKHSMNAVKAYVADHTTATNRAVELGRMATASALGIMVGPAVGGMLFKVAILTRPRVAALMAVRAVLGLAVHLFRQGFSLLLIYRLNLPVHTNGLLLSLQGFSLLLIYHLNLPVHTNRLLLSLQGFSLLLIYRLNLPVHTNGLLLSLQVSSAPLHIAGSPHIAGTGPRHASLAALMSKAPHGLAIRPLLHRFPEAPLIFRGLLLLSLTLALLAAAPSLVSRSPMCHVVCPRPIFCQPSLTLALFAAAPSLCVVSNLMDCSSLYHALSICLFCFSLCLFFCVSICLFFCVSICLFFCVSICLFFCVSICLFFCVSICLFFCVSICLFFCVFICLFFCVSICLFFCVSICLFFCVSICLFFSFPDPIATSARPINRCSPHHIHSPPHHLCRSERLKTRVLGPSSCLLRRLKTRVLGPSSCLLRRLKTRVLGPSSCLLRRLKTRVLGPSSCPPDKCTDPLPHHTACHALFPPLPLPFPSPAPPNNQVGQLLGLSDAIMSACRVLGPSAAGLLSSQFGYHAPVAVSAVIAATAALLFHLLVLRRHQPASAATGILSKGHLA